MTMQDILDRAEKYADNYEVVAIRTQEQPFELGSILHCSKVWIDGDETDEEIDGISATSITSSAVKKHSDDHGFDYYYGHYTAIVCGNDYERGEDIGEVIIKGAVVVEILK